MPERKRTSQTLVPPSGADLARSIQEKFERDTLPALKVLEQWRRDSYRVKWPKPTEQPKFKVDEGE